MPAQGTQYFIMGCKICIASRIGAGDLRRLPLQSICKLYSFAIQYVMQSVEEIHVLETNGQDSETMFGKPRGLGFAYQLCIRANAYYVILPTVSGSKGSIMPGSLL